MPGERNKALEEAQKRAHDGYVEMVKSHVLDFLKVRRAYRLSELWEQRRVSPLADMSLKELTDFLNKNGCTIVKSVDYIISKRK